MYNYFNQWVMVCIMFSWNKHWMSKALAKRTGKLSQVDASWTCAETFVGWPNGSQVSPQVHASCKKKTFQGRLSFILLANNRLMDVTQLVLTWVGQPNGEKLACKFDLDQSEHKSLQVNASECKPWPNEVASWPKSSTCVNLCLRLARA